MIPYAKFFASRRVIPRTSAYASSTAPRSGAVMPAPPLLCALRRAYALSSHEHDRGLTCKPGARGLRPLREDVPVRILERLERGKAAAREEADGAAEPPADSRAEQITRLQERGGALGLETEQRAKVVAWPVERRRPEALAVFAGQVHAAELEVARHVLQEVHELEPGADRVARRDELGVVEPAEHAEHEPTARVGRMDAVLLHLVPGLVLGHALVDTVRLDEAEERLTRQIELADGRLHVQEHRPRGLSLECEHNLRVQLAERFEPVAVVAVTELVDEPGIAIQGADVRAQRAREEHGADGEVLARRP